MGASTANKRRTARIGKYCNLCGACAKICPAGAIHFERGACWVEAALCAGCGRCVDRCRAHAISWAEEARAV